MIKDFVRLAFDLLGWLIIVRAILSWIPAVRYNRYYHMLVEMTEVFIHPVRKLLPQGGGAIDIAPLVTFFLIQVVQQIVLGIL